MGMLRGLFGPVVMVAAAGVIALPASAQVRSIGSVGANATIGGSGGAAASLVSPSQRYDAYDVVPTLKNRRSGKKGSTGGSEPASSRGATSIGVIDSGDRKPGRYGGSFVDRETKRREARLIRQKRAAARAKKLRFGFPGPVLPFVVDRDDDDDTIVIIEQAPPPPEPEPEDTGPEFSPAEPMRLRVGQREPGPTDDTTAAVTIRLSADGDSVEGVAGALDTKRDRVLRAVALADGSACIQGPPALDITADEARGFRGEGSLALRVADAGTVLGIIAALPDDTVSGITTGFAAIAAPAEEAPSEQASARGFQRVPNGRAGIGATVP
ncbi:MAG: hypothetical protein AAF899_16985, partial [Pseudomonadota bacterium]